MVKKSKTKKVKSGAIKFSPELKIPGTGGATLRLDLDKMKLNSQQRKAMQKLIQSGNINKLSPKERQSIAKKKSLINSGPQALVVRFDWTWVRIDE